MIRFVILVSRQGKVRLNRWYVPVEEKEKGKSTREVVTLVLNRHPKMCNILEWKEYKIVYKRYASLYFITCIDHTENELAALEVIQHFVEVLDRYFGNVCELDLIFNFHKAYYLLDEILLGGELIETSKRQVLRMIAAQDALQGTQQDQRTEI